MKNIDMAKFPKYKKKLYKEAVENYQTYLKKSGKKTESIYKQKLEIEPFVNSENVKPYAENILRFMVCNMENLFYAIKYEDKGLKYGSDVYMKNIYNLATLKIFDNDKNINKDAIFNLLCEMASKHYHYEVVEVDLTDLLKK